MLKNYIKTAFKVFLRRKFFTAISLFGISFTLVVLMVATAFLDHAFGSYPPEVKTDRTLGVFTLIGELIVDGERKGGGSGPPSYTFLDRYVRTLSGVEKVSISTQFFRDNAVAVYKDGEYIELYLKRTDGEFWQILEFDFLEGSPFTAEDEKNANMVAVINQATRKRFFGDERATGKSIEVDGQRFRVVGVVANIPIFRAVPFADVWVPISTSKEDYRYMHWNGRYQALVLAKKPSDIPLIKAEFQAHLAQAQVEFLDPKEFNRLYGGVESYFETVSREIFNPAEADKESHADRLLAVIAGAMVLFMLLPTLNLVNLNMSRTLERASEIGVRKAFGASSWTLVGQFVVENVLLVLTGGVIALVASSLVLQALTYSELIQYAEFYLNYRLFLYGLLIALFFGVLSGVYPAWRMSRLQPVQALKRRAR